MPPPDPAADRSYMRRAIILARQGAASGAGGPIGCVIVRNGAVIGEAHNEVFARCDATAHAEITAMRRAGARLGEPTFRGATLYTTLQPCGMCSMAAIWSGVVRIVCGAERRHVHPMYFEDRHMETIDFIRDAYRDDLSIEGGVLSEECAALYYGPGDNPPRDAQTNL
jgi:tRNA(adenine34) deaminase